MNTVEANALFAQYMNATSEYDMILSGWVNLLIPTLSDLVADFRTGEANTVVLRWSTKNWMDCWMQFRRSLMIRSGLMHSGACRRSSRKKFRGYPGSFGSERGAPTPIWSFLKSVGDRVVNRFRSGSGAARIDPDFRRNSGSAQSLVLPEGFRG